MQWEMVEAEYETGRSYLSAGQEEESGFGLYSYLIFTEKPDENSLLECQACFAAWLSKVSKINDKFLLQDFFHVHPKIASLRMEEFLAQASKARYYDGKELSKFSHHLRNAVAIAAEGTGEVAESLNWR